MRNYLMSDTTALHAKIDAITAHMATRDDLTEMRAAIMARIDRLQDASTIQHHERIVDVYFAERSERPAARH